MKENYRYTYSDIIFMNTLKASRPLKWFSVTFFIAATCMQLGIKMQKLIKEKQTSVRQEKKK